MKTLWMIVAIAAQVALLAVMAGQREWIQRFGRPMKLRTAPIDPRDPMRGDYVRLSYDFSNVPRQLCRDGAEQWFKQQGDDWQFSRRLMDAKVYAVFDESADGVVTLRSLTDREPASGLYLRGRVSGIDHDSIRVRYGVEALFMEQGSAKALEDEQRGENAGVPLEVTVGVSGGGLAVVRSWKWEPLGIRITLDRPAEEPPSLEVREQNRARNRDNAREPQLEQERERERRRARGLRGVTVELFNRGSEPVAIVDRADGRSLRLIGEARWGDRAAEWALKDEPLPAAKAADVVVLQPGESRKIHVDLTRREWEVVFHADERAAPERKRIADLVEENRLWFRFEYVPPTSAESAGLPNAKLIRHAPLRSRGFSAGFAID